MESGPFSSSGWALWLFECFFFYSFLFMGFVGFVLFAVCLVDLSRFFFVPWSGRVRKPHFE